MQTHRKTVMQTITEGWRYRCDPDGIGFEEQWQNGLGEQAQPVDVPGLAPSYALYTWYEVAFVPILQPQPGERVCLCLAGAPYETEYWLNGEPIGSHTGRHDAFYFDVTDYLGQTCRLTVMTANPSVHKAYRGLTQAHVGVTFVSQARFQQPVRLVLRPEVRLEDVFVRADIASSSVTVTATVLNASPRKTSGKLSVTVSEKGQTYLCGSSDLVFETDVGETTVTASVPMERFSLWSPEHPSLYTVTVVLSDDDSGLSDIQTFSTAFRSLRVNANGYFELNGKRIYLKMTHMANTWPLSHETAKDLSGYRRMLIYLKSCGFNAIRQLASCPLPQLLDLCDELGLIVYGEHPMAWHKKDCEQTASLFEMTVKAALRRDRNHPCFLLFGMQNETLIRSDGPSPTVKLYQAVRNSLSYARPPAPDVVFLLQSARFDGNRSLGSACNPGSIRWDGYMGDESPDAPDTVVDHHIPNYFTPGMGDVHLYPVLPHGKRTKDTLASFDSMRRGVFFSEAGVGSLANVFASKLYLEQYGITPRSPEEARIAEHCEQFRAFYTAYRLDRIFATPEAAFRASYALQGKQRRLYFDYIRRVDRFSGYSMTMASDAEYKGEGIVGTFHEPKTTMADVMYDGWYDLRFCITVNHTVLWQEDLLELDIVLSDFGVLKEGQSYPIAVTLNGADGTVWSKTLTFVPRVGANGELPFATTLLNEKLPLRELPPGAYTIAAEFLAGAYATGGERTVYVRSRKELPTLGTVYGKDLPHEVVSLLHACGAHVEASLPHRAPAGRVILVGSNSLYDRELTELYALAEAGAHVVILTPEALIRTAAMKSEDEGTERIDFSLAKVNDIRVPFKAAGSLSHFGNWLYHYEYAVHESHATAGLPSRCLMDPEYYEQIWSNKLFRFTDVPQEPAVSGFLAGHDMTGDLSFKCGFQLGTFTYGRGLITLNALRLIESVGSPVADLILCNLAAYIPYAESEELQ
ncbi:MAG: hypothetical protein E7618_00660 [Ruminococcaceae bacterium]|nr:hypothetical protein [Oscillospiraceae bacterium]